MNVSKNQTKEPEIVLIMLSQIDADVTGLVRQKLANMFCRPVLVRYEISNLKYAYDAVRNQFISPRVLSRLRRLKKGRGDKIMAVTDVDMYSPGYDFVYGEADVQAGVATLSINRLLPETGDVSQKTDTVAERIIREATHEMGHLFGLGHCPNQKCVMRTCTCLAEVDEAQGGLCAGCFEQLKPKLA